MKELSFILGVIRFINNRLVAIAARAEVRFNKEREKYEILRAKYETKAEALQTAKVQAKLVNKNLREIIGD